MAEPTAAMIEAGAAVLVEKFDTGPYWARAVAKEVYAAMMGATESGEDASPEPASPKPETDH